MPSTKVDGIRAEIDSMDVSTSAIDMVPPNSSMDPEQRLHSFPPLTECDVRALIQKSAVKSCKLDPMPTSLVIECLDVVLSVVTNIVNTSLATGHFPDEWKQALVHPLLKKVGLSTAYKNLRPVSNLQFISKVTERAACAFHQIHTHMSKNGLYPLLQSAYRTNHSTETALVRVMNDICINMNHQHVTLLVLLDLSAAFDTVDHAILLNRLESTFGITGTALVWLKSYLSGRSLRVSVDGGLSDSFHLPFGVPQGSCLGPLLFTMYASKLFEVIKDHLPMVHAYADDTQLYLSFKPGCTVTEQDAIRTMERCIKAIRIWMLTDKLKLNEEKTEFMVIGTRQQLGKVSIGELSVGDSNVVPVSAARNLGVWLGSHMNLDTHITKTCSAAYYHLYNIRRIRKHLTYESTRTLVHALVMGRIDYCNSLLYGLPNIQIDKL